jgi:superfamily II DNA helicase RecQ
VEQSIIACLQLQSPVIIKGGFNRPNIQYQVQHVASDDRHPAETFLLYAM